MPTDYTVSTATPTDQAQSLGVGPTSPAEKDPYSVSQLRYPLSGIGTTEVPSYVVFYINLPQTSKYLQQNSDQAVANVSSASTQNYDTLNAAGGTYNPAGTGVSNLAGAVALAGGASAIKNGLIAGGKEAIGAAGVVPLLRTLDLRPKLTRIKQSIAIYMPDTYYTTYQHNWSTVNATDAGGDIAKYAQIGGSFGDAVKSIEDAIGTIAKNVTGNKRTQFNSAQSAELAADTAEKVFRAVGQGFTDLTLRAQGVAINPHVEMLFRATQNRNYIFQFHFVPRSQQEAVAIYNIIKTFKAFAAPEVSNKAGGRYFIPPAQFDIQFYFMNAENPVLAKISTCVLNSITVNYVGDGTFATFNDGMPTHIDVQMDFTEADIITRELISEYGY